MSEDCWETSAKIQQAFSLGVDLQQFGEHRVYDPRLLALLPMCGENFI